MSKKDHPLAEVFAAIEKAGGRIEDLGVVRRAMDADDDSRSDPWGAAKYSPAVKHKILQDACENFSKRFTFKVGDMVRGKQGLTDNIKDARAPHVVMEILEYPRATVDVSRDLSDMSSAGAVFVYDIVVGCVVTDGATALFLADSRFWEPYPAEELTQ